MTYKNKKNVHAGDPVEVPELNIGDMIKRNYSDVENIDFELQALKGGKFLCFTLFLNFKKSSYLCNQMSD